jgi:hypothetical protein
MYQPYEMLRNLAPREMTASQQREAEEQRGQTVAAVTRWGRRVGAQVHAVAALPVRRGHQPAAFRKARRRAPYRALQGIHYRGICAPDRRAGGVAVAACRIARRSSSVVPPQTPERMP